MKLPCLTTLVTLAAVTSTAISPATAAPFPEMNLPVEIAGFLDDVIPKVPTGNDANESEPSAVPAGGDRNASGTAAFEGFSGESTTYTDSFNGFKIDIPAEFTLQGKGATTNWSGPLLVGTDASGEDFTGSGLISVNTVEWTAGNPGVACTATVTQYQNDRFYPNEKIASKQVKFGEIPATVVFFEESIYQRGTRDEKKADDHHRVHFQVCGNGRIYNGTLGYYYGFFNRDDMDIYALFDTIRQSFSLVPADNAPLDQ